MICAANNTVQPRSTPTKRIDFTKIDTPEEAMLSPGGDLWVGLVLGPLEGKVTVLSGDQSLYYETKKDTPNSLKYTGLMNGTPFTLEGVGTPKGIHVIGHTPGGAIDSLRQGGGGGFGLDGSAGVVDFHQILALDRSGAEGKLAYLGGNIGGLEYDARAVKGPNGTVEVNGTLGDMKVHQTIREGDHQEWIISGTVGESRFTEIIERT